MNNDKIRSKITEAMVILQSIKMEILYEEKEADKNDKSRDK